MFRRKKKRKPNIMTLQCHTCRQTAQQDVNRPSIEWPTCHGRTMPVLRRSLKWPDVPFQCPRCGTTDLKQVPLSSFNQGSLAVRYGCGSLYMSDRGEPWYLASKLCVEWDWLWYEGSQ